MISNKKQKNIPKGWQEKKLGDICIFKKGKGLPKSEIKDNAKNECIHYGELFTKYNEKITQIISFANIEKDKMILSKINDILMPTSDVTPRGLSTASCIMNKNVILGGDVLIIRCKNEDLNGLFFSYYVSACKKEVIRLVSGTTVFHLYGSDMARFKLFLPPLSEQKQIVKILETWDKCLEKLSRKIELKKNIKKGLMQRLLTGKVRLTGFSGELEKIEFNQCLNVLKKPKGLKSQDYEVLGYPIIDQSDNKYISGYTNKLEYIYDYSLSKSVILFGDHSRTLKYINQKVAFGNDGIKLFQAKDGFNTKFMYFKLLIQKVPNTGYNRHFKYLKDEIFKLPALKEQTAIAKILTTADKEIEVLEKKRKIIEDQKKYLLNNLVTGKIRIPEFSK